MNKRDLIKYLRDKADAHIKMAEMFQSDTDVTVTKASHHADISAVYSNLASKMEMVKAR